MNGQFNGYMFNPVGIPLPGQAYHAPLLQFQDYPYNTVQDRGTLVQRFFRPYTPLTYVQQLQPVNGGTSGIITGQNFFQPLVDTGRAQVG